MPTFSPIFALLAFLPFGTLASLLPQTQLVFRINPNLPGPNDVFVGYRGTNNVVGAIYERDGIKDTPMNNGADAELGPGSYITDDLFTAQIFASGSAGNNPGTTATVCKIYADGVQWRGAPKGYLPVLYFGNGQAAEQTRQTYLQGLDIPGTAIRFANLAKTPNQGPTAPRQMVVPSGGLQTLLKASCFPANHAALPQVLSYFNVRAALPPGWNIRTGPEFPNWTN